MFILETDHINYSNLKVKLTNICILEQEQFDLKNHIKLKWSVLLLGLSCTETRA
jgi:hypothetical protein